MDKYEFNIKVEQIKKLVTKGDFTTSMKIADTIDWRRVRNTNLLAMISQVYEKNGEYQEAKEVLLQAYERSAVGKRLLFKLAELALREGNVREAEDYYREFSSVAQGDARQNLLRYLILKTKGAPARQLIGALEKYVASELDERWMYELAELYAGVGEKALCVQMCDKITLMFAFGKYVDKALELKSRFAVLSDYQQDLVQHPDKYEAQYKAVEQEFANGALDVFGDDDGDAAERYSTEMLFPDHDYADESQYDSREADGEEARGAEEQYEDEQPGEEEAQPQDVYGGEEAFGEPDGAAYENQEEDVPEDGMPAEEQAAAGGRVTLDEELVANLHQAEAEEELAREMSRITRDGYTNAEDVPMGQTKKLYDIHRTLKPVVETETPGAQIVDDETAGGEPKQEEEEAEASAAEKEEEPATETDGEEAETSEADGTADDAPQEPEARLPRFITIETRTPEKGIERAVERLKAYHLQNNSHNQTIKISGGRLNERGVDAVADKLAGKDLIVDEAGDLSGEELDKLKRLMAADESGMVVVLLDNPRQMEDLYEKYPETLELFVRIDGEENVEKAVPVILSPEEEAEAILEGEGDVVADLPADSMEDELPEIGPEDDRREDDYRQEMDPDSFAEYACNYAAEIDCSITGKSMLALYERVELMEEDGIPLTKENAETMIEDAADRAEKPSLGRLITGVFSVKYNREGLLILREEHFI